MRTFAGDLHVHTALSPCAEPTMTPRRIVAAARRAALDLIAVCDHNGAGNTAAARAAAGDAPAVLPGIEITTSEEAHLLGIFAEPSAALAVDAVVAAGLPPLRRRPRWMGPQLLLTADDEERGREPRMLAAASVLSLAEAVALIHAHGGLAVGAHVDRPTFSITSQLGAIPDDLPLEAVEVSASGVAAGAAARFVRAGWSVVTSSDSHTLATIGAARTLFDMNAPTFAELALALRQSAGRRCRLA